MKNRFIFCVLMSAIIFVFTGEASMQKPTKSELLTYLRNIRVELLGRISSDPEIPENQQRESNFAFKIINEFYNSSDILQRLILNDVESDFMPIYENMLPLSIPPRYYISHEPYISLSISDETKEQLFPLFKDIFDKHHENYRMSNPEGNLAHVTAEQVFDEAIEIIFLRSGSQERNAWLEVIDSKIAELEMEI